MEAQEIRNIYETLSNEPAAYANALVERAGTAQASLGPLAGAVRGGSQTANIGNYTYNRTVRPTVDALRSAMVAEGINQWANKLLSDAIQGARDNYGNAYNAYARRMSGGTTGGTTTSDAWQGDIDNEKTDDVVNDDLNWLRQQGNGDPNNQAPMLSRTQWNSLSDAEKKAYLKKTDAEKWTWLGQNFDMGSSWEDAGWDTNRLDISSWRRK